MKVRSGRSPPAARDFAAKLWSNDKGASKRPSASKPGARAGFIGKNSDRYFEMLHGAFKAKAVVVGVNWRLAPPEIAYVLNDAKVELVFVGAEFYDTVVQVLAECPSVRRVVALDGGRTGFPSTNGATVSPRPVRSFST